MNLRSYITLICLGLGCLAIAGTPVSAQDYERNVHDYERNVHDYERNVAPILAEHCFGCHADGEKEGNLSFDEISQLADPADSHEQWHRVLRQLQSGLMPPPEEERLSAQNIATIQNWIKYGEFGLDPQNPDPGRVTVRRLNQVEYRNTIRDLIGVDYDTSSNFPADDTGHGFDNIGDVLSVSPLLLEKYVNAAKEIVSSTVPMVSGVLREQSIAGDQFELAPVSLVKSLSGEGSSQQRRPPPAPGTTELSYYDHVAARAVVSIEDAGDYVVRLNVSAKETYVDNQFDENKCEFTFAIDDRVVLQREFVRQGSKDFHFDFEQTLSVGEHSLVATVKPLSEARQIRNLRMQIKSVDLLGPQDEKYFAKPTGYDQFFPRPVPDSAEERRAYARELLSAFATRAFRRPVGDDSVERLVALAESVYAQGNATFEAGIAKSMTAVLASPRFLFREETTIEQGADPFPQVDEYSLASRLSYFLWSSMPDEELTQLAREGNLRKQLDQQVARMLKDPKAGAFAENFVGQWLRARAIDTIQINSRAVASREPRVTDPDADVRRQRFFTLFRKGERRTKDEDAEFEVAKVAFQRSFGRGPKFALNEELRHAMRRETELLFQYIVDQDRSLLDLIDADYTFLNEALWGHYQIGGIAPVEGDAMRLVRLPRESFRGGVLTQGTILAVTSNPDRTSPVKRGLFILENLLGTPPAAPPPNVPSLEDVEPDVEKTLTLRETLAIHRENDLCSSCHNRMDPLGLALENFNALGRYRTQELDQPIDASGVLATGEAFSTINDLKTILVTARKTDFYRCLTEKLMTYALGRAVEYTDVDTVDDLVAKLKASDGKASTLIYGIIHSNAFQRTRKPTRKGT